MNPLVDGGNREYHTVCSEGMRKESRSEDASWATVQKFGDAQRGTYKDFARSESEGIYLLVRQAGSGVKGVQLARVPMKHPAVACADPQITRVASQRGDGEIRQVGMEG